MAYYNYFNTKFENILKEVKKGKSFQLEIIIHEMLSSFLEIDNILNDPIIEALIEQKEKNKSLSEKIDYLEQKLSDVESYMKYNSNYDPPYYG